MAFFIDSARPVEKRACGCASPENC